MRNEIFKLNELVSKAGKFLVCEKGGFFDDN
jgi:hypothetical protein